MRKDEIIAMLALLKENAYSDTYIDCEDTGICDVKLDSFKFVIDETIKLINYLSDHKTQWEEIKI